MSRRLNLVTASSSELADLCLAPWLPGSEWESKTSWSMKLGSAIHRCMERFLTGRDFDHKAMGDEFSLTARQVDIMKTAWRGLHGYLTTQCAEWLPKMEGEIKFAISWDMARAERLPPSAERDYSACEDWALSACTIDATWLHEGVGRFWELKTGGGYLPAPGQHPQMQLQALMMARAHGLDSIVGTLVKATERECVAIPNAFDMFDLLAIEERLLSWTRRSADPTPGEHCHRRCKKLNCSVRAEKAA